MILIGLYAIWITFIDTDSIWSLAKLNQEANTLKKENEFFKREIQEAKEKRTYLFSNMRNLEKFARENYLMKREDEDVYIIITE